MAEAFTLLEPPLQYDNPAQRFQTEMGAGRILRSITTSSNPCASSTKGNPSPTIPFNNIQSNGTLSNPWNVRAETFYGTSLSFQVDVEKNGWGSAERPYHVVGSLVVRRDATLPIRPGVNLFFSRNRFLLTNGTLQGLGTGDRPVVFRSGYAPSQAGDWAGIKADAGALVLKHTTVRDANRGVTAGASSATVVDLLVRPCYTCF